MRARSSWETRSRSRTRCCVFGMIVLLTVSSSAGGGKRKTATATAAVVTVDKSGAGDHRTIQAAVDAVASGNRRAPVLILVKPGIYREKVVVPSDKPFVTLSGSSVANTNSTVITWSEAWTNPNSGTVSIHASDFVGRYLTIENTLGRGAPGIAVRVSGDRVAFYSSTILSYQDTLLDDKGRHYYRNCYIQGATDFICGSGLSLFDGCHIHSISSKDGAITAQRRTSAAENTGYSFVNCVVTGTGAAFLGRPWGAYSRTVFAFTYMSSAVLPQGWNDWDVQTNQRTVFYGEYKCRGPGSSVANRVRWAREMSDEEASQFTTISMIDGQEWLRPPPITIP